MFNTFLGEVKGYFGKAFVLAVWLPVFIFAVALVTVYMAVDHSLAAIWQQWQQWTDLQKSLVPISIFLSTVTFIAFVIHYLQVPITRLFEGYWQDVPLLKWLGLNRLSRWKRWRYKRHLKEKEDSLSKLGRDIPRLRRELPTLAQSISALEEQSKNIKEIGLTQKIQQLKENILCTLEREIDNKQAEVDRLTLTLTQRFPPLGYEKHLKPTRLGNIYKAVELCPFERYGIDSVFFWKHLRQVLPDKFVEQLQEVKIATDFFLLCSLLCVLFPVITVPYLIIHNASIVLIVLCTLTLLLGWLSYEAALIPAFSYAELIRVAFDLYRRTLLKEFNLTPPDNIEDEKRLWRNLTDFLFRGFPLPTEVHFSTDDKKS